MRDEFGLPGVAFTAQRLEPHMPSAKVTVETINKAIPHCHAERDGENALRALGATGVKVVQGGEERAELSYDYAWEGSHPDAQDVLRNHNVRRVES